MSITITLKKNLSEANRVDKSFAANVDIQLTGTFKEKQDLVRPQLVVETDTNLKDFNYCEIPEFGRSYFMHPHVQQTHLWILELEVDVLSTYKVGLRASEALVKRTCQDGKMNFYINDGVFYTEQREIITYDTFKKVDANGDRVDAVLGTDSYYLIVAGG